jgi:hypothetical protein
MPTPGTNRHNGTQSVGSAAGTVAYHAKTLAKLEFELASLELKKKIAVFGIGIGLLVAAALFGFFALWFGLATIAAALATFLDTWLALLIVFAGLLLLSGVLALIGLSRVRKATPPVPEQAIQEAKLTSEALKSE